MELEKLQLHVIIDSIDVNHNTISFITVICIYIYIYTHTHYFTLFNFFLFSLVKLRVFNAVISKHGAGVVSVQESAHALPIILLRMYNFNNE